MAGGGGDSEGGDYWPGYVDALTAMVKVLAFVMMLLAVTVFMLSQKISKQAIQTLAEAANVEVPPDADVKEIARQIRERIANPTPSNAPPPPPPQAAPTQAQESQSASVLPTARTESRAVDSESRASDPVQARRMGSQFTIAFTNRTTRLDEDASKKIVEFVRENNMASAIFEIRAAADATQGSLSDARRIAYYRAMQVRQQLIVAGATPDRLTIRVVDTTAGIEEGRTVTINARR